MLYRYLLSLLYELGYVLIVGYLVVNIIGMFLILFWGVGGVLEFRYLVDFKICVITRRGRINMRLKKCFYRKNRYIVIFEFGYVEIILIIGIYIECLLIVFDYYVGNNDFFIFINILENFCMFV